MVRLWKADHSLYLITMLKMPARFSTRVTTYSCDRHGPIKTRDCYAVPSQKPGLCHTSISASASRFIDSATFSSRGRRRKCSQPFSASVSCCVSVTMVTQTALWGCTRCCCSFQPRIILCNLTASAAALSRLQSSAQTFASAVFAPLRQCPAEIKNDPLKFS